MYTVNDIWYKYISNNFIAQYIAKHSLSVCEYLHWTSVSVLLAQATGLYSSLDCCWLVSHPNYMDYHQLQFLSEVPVCNKPYFWTYQYEYQFTMLQKFLVVLIYIPIEHLFVWVFLEALSVASDCRFKYWYHIAWPYSTCGLINVLYSCKNVSLSRKVNVRLQIQMILLALLTAFWILNMYIILH